MTDRIKGLLGDNELYPVSKAKLIKYQNSFLPSVYNTEEALDALVYNINASIVESGKLSNGFYTKYADGRYRENVIVSGNTTDKGYLVYESNDFMSIDFVNVTNRYISNSASLEVHVVADIIDPKKQVICYFRTNANGAAFNIEASVYMDVWGRWKEADSEPFRPVLDITKIQNQINQLSEALQALITECPYDVGDVIYKGSSAFDPNKKWPGTTWQRIKGRVVVGVDENDSDFSTVGKTDGAKTFNNSHEHTTTSVALKATQLPILTGSMSFHGAGSGGATVLNGGSCSGIISAKTVRSAYRNGGGDLSGATSADGINISFGGNQAHGHGNTGSSGSNAQSLLQPYITKYIWERTA